MRLYSVNLNQEGRVCFGSADDEDILKKLKWESKWFKEF